MTLTPEHQWLIGVGLTVLGLYLGAVWMVVKAGTTKTEQLLLAHTAGEARDVAEIKKATQSLIDGMGRLDLRVTRLETERGALPSAGDVNQLALQVSQLSGRIETIHQTGEARIEKVETLLARVDLVVRRLEEYLLIRSRGGEA